PTKIAQLAGAANIDGDPKTLTDKELAAWLIAKSMQAPSVGGGDPPTHVFDNKLSSEELLGGVTGNPFSNRQDPKLVFETARQIFGDAMKGAIKGGVNTTTPEGNKPYLSAVDNSPNTTKFRC